MECIDTVSTKQKKICLSNSRKKSIDEESTSMKEKGKGEKRAKKRKTSDSSKKIKKEECVETKSALSGRHSSTTPDSELRQDQSDSPMTDDVFEGSNSSQESNEMLSMSFLLKSVLDTKKKLLLESDEIRQFFLEHMIKKEL